MTRTQNDLERAVRELCLAFPHSEEILSHGAPNFRVRGGKIYATFAANHHGDGRLALWVKSSDGEREPLLREDPKNYFVPAYVGPYGWLGVRLDQGLDWREVAARVHAAYLAVAPRRLAPLAAAAPSTRPPRRRLTVADVDPFQSKRGKALLAVMRKACLRLPQTSEDVQFGHAVWRVGKKVFARAWHRNDRFQSAFWVGIDLQGLMTRDPRFEIPPYMGHIGWIALESDPSPALDEVRGLARSSYRHFAGKRLLAKLDAEETEAVA